VDGPPKPEINYAGFIIYDKGHWSDSTRQIYPGQVVMMDIDNMKFENHEGLGQPHRPLCRYFFGME